MNTTRPSISTFIQARSVGDAAARPAPGRVRTGTARRPGFTLVELLVVIMIVAMLAALVTVAASRALTAARNAAIKAEIDMLHMAIMNYKNEYGSFPPCYDSLTLTGTSVAGKHVARIFPRATNLSSQFTTLLNSKTPAYVVPTNAIPFWLSGYTSDSTSPLSPGNRQKLFDFNLARVDSTTGIYFPSGKGGSPYVYIVPGEYGNAWPPAAFTYSVGGNSYTIAAGAYFAQPQNGQYTNAPPFANPDTFQILCAGRDEVFGNDDDLSNFWPGTRKDYRDSLTQ